MGAFLAWFNPHAGRGEKMVFADSGFCRRVPEEDSEGGALESPSGVCGLARIHLPSL